MIDAKNEKYYLTTAIAYTSRKPHVGNTYEVILADAIARAKRAMGYDVFFLTGTDEHGQKIENDAKANGISPKEHVDRVAGEVKKVYDLMGASYDKFIRTTDDYHEKAVQKIFKKLYEQGDIYLGEYSGMYCLPCEAFYTKSQLTEDGKCPVCGADVTETKEKAYFLKLSKYADRLKDYINEHPDFIFPESRKNEMVKNFLDAGLQDLCVSRTSFKWGIPVDFDPDHVIYVWVDALSNYITAMGYSVDEKGELYSKYWPADVQIIGKDILRFHVLIWPIILMALGEPLPKHIFGHPWLLFGADKMSKSKGNVIYADDLVERFGVDAVRYYLLSEMPYGNDGSITYEAIVSKYNTDLANTLGNLVSRTIAMIKKYFGGTIPAPEAKGEHDDELISTAISAAEKCEEKINAFMTADALDEIFTLLSRCNKYIDETAPWILAKSEDTLPRLKTVMYNLAESIRTAAVLLSPFMPATSAEIIRQLGTDKNTWQSVGKFGVLEAGTKVADDASALFARLDEQKVLEEIYSEIEAKKAAATAKQYAPVASEINIDTFASVDLRVGKILSCEPVKKSDKLLVMQIDLGFETRQIVSGIAKFYKPEQLIGKKVAVVANLAPVKLRGVESNGMILASGEEDVRVLFIDDAAECGSKIR